MVLAIFILHGYKTHKRCFDIYFDMKVIYSWDLFIDYFGTFVEYTPSLSHFQYTPLLSHFQDKWKNCIFIDDVKWVT